MLVCLACGEATRAATGLTSTQTRIVGDSFFKEGKYKQALDEYSKAIGMCVRACACQKPCHAGCGRGRSERI